MQRRELKLQPLHARRQRQPLLLRLNPRKHRQFPAIRPDASDKHRRLRGVAVKQRGIQPHKSLGGGENQRPVRRFHRWHDRELLRRETVAEIDHQRVQIRKITAFRQAPVRSQPQPSRIVRDQLRNRVVRQPAAPGHRGKNALPVQHQPGTRRANPKPAVRCQRQKPDHLTRQPVAFSKAPPLPLNIPPVKPAAPRPHPQRPVLLLVNRRHRFPPLTRISHHFEPVPVQRQELSRPLARPEASCRAGATQRPGFPMTGRKAGPRGFPAIAEWKHSFAARQPHTAIRRFPCRMAILRPAQCGILAQPGRNPVALLQLVPAIRLYQRSTLNPQLSLPPA
jgi:hypothetical protein